MRPDAGSHTQRDTKIDGAAELSSRTCVLSMLLDNFLSLPRPPRGGRIFLHAVRTPLLLGLRLLHRIDHRAGLEFIRPHHDLLFRVGEFRYVAGFFHDTCAWPESWL